MKRDYYHKQKRIAELSGQNNEFLPLNEIDTNIKEFKPIDNN